MTQQQYHLMRQEHTAEWIAATFPRSVRSLAESGCLPQDEAVRLLKLIEECHRRKKY